MSDYKPISWGEHMDYQQRLRYDILAFSRCLVLAEEGKIARLITELVEYLGQVEAEASYRDVVVSGQDVQRAIDFGQKGN